MRFLLQHPATKLFMRKHDKGASWGPREGATLFIPHSYAFDIACSLAKQAKLVPVSEDGENTTEVLEKIEQEYGKRVLKSIGVI